MAPIPDELAPKTFYIDIQTTYDQPAAVYYAFLNLFGDPIKKQMTAQEIENQRPEDYYSHDNLNKNEDFKNKIINKLLKSHMLTITDLEISKTYIFHFSIYCPFSNIQLLGKAFCNIYLH